MRTSDLGRTVYADDETLRRALALAERLPPSGRKPAEYLLASAVLELHQRLIEAQGVADLDAAS